MYCVLLTAAAQKKNKSNGLCLKLISHVYSPSKLSACVTKKPSSIQYFIGIYGGKHIQLEDG